MGSRGDLDGGPLCRAFFVVGVAVDATGAPAPKLLLRRTFGGNSDADELLVKVSFEKHFCFPEYVHGSLTSLVPETHLKPSSYSFVLTEGDGSRTTGVCRRFLPPGDGARVPIVTCLLSRKPWLRFFAEVLEPLDAQVFLCAKPGLLDVSGSRPESQNPLLHENTHLYAYIHALCTAQNIMPRQELRLPINWHPIDSNHLPRSVAFNAPDSGTSTSKTQATANRGVKFTHILRGKFTDCAPAVALFTALLFERRVVVSGSDMSSVSGAVQAAAATLTPFKWHHIFLPILPQPFLEYLTAPMPFLCGVHASFVPFIKSLPTEELFHLNLDTGEYTYFEQDLDALPSKPRRALELKLQAQLEQGRIDDAAVAHAFRVFLSTTIASYRKHVIPETSERRVPQNAIVTNGLWLDQDSFISSAATRRTRLLLGALKSTRLFEIFLREMLTKIANDPKQHGMIGARLGHSTAGKDLRGRGTPIKRGLMGDDGGGRGGSSNSNGSSSVFEFANSSVTAEAALLAYAAEDFEHELSNDAAFTAMYRAGSASAVAGAAQAAAATTRAASSAATAAKWGARTGAKMFDAFVGSARKKTERALSTSGHVSSSYLSSRQQYDTFTVHDDDSPVGNHGNRSDKFVGVDRFRNEKGRFETFGNERPTETHKGVNTKKPPSVPTNTATAAASAQDQRATPKRAATAPHGLFIDVHARASVSATPSPTALEGGSPVSNSPSVSRTSSGSMAAAVAAATARMSSLSPTGIGSPHGGVSSPHGTVISPHGTVISPNGSVSSPRANTSSFPPTGTSSSPTFGANRISGFSPPSSSGNGSPKVGRNTTPDPFTAAVLQNTPPLLQAVPTNRRKPSRTDWVDFDTELGPSAPPVASPASVQSAISPTATLVDPFAGITVNTAAQAACLVQQHRSVTAPQTQPISPPADPGDALAAALGLGSPTSAPTGNLMDF